MSRTSVCSTPGCPNLKPCPEHGRPRNARWSRERSSRDQHRFRSAVMRRSGGLCERCRRHPAQVAHHVRPGYSAADGLALCHACHREIDVNARGS